MSTDNSSCRHHGRVLTDEFIFLPVSALRQAEEIGISSQSSQSVSTRGSTNTSNVFVCQKTFLLVTIPTLPRLCRKVAPLDGGSTFPQILVTAPPPTSL